MGTSEASMVLPAFASPTSIDAVRRFQIDALVEFSRGARSVCVAREGRDRARLRRQRHHAIALRGVLRIHEHAVAREVGHERAPDDVGQLLDFAARDIHAIDVEDAGSIRREQDAGTVRRVQRASRSSLGD